MNGAIVLRTLFVALMGVALLAGIRTASAADPSSLMVAASSELDGQVLRIGLNKSVVLNMPEDVTDVLVSNPEIADAVIRSQRQIYLIGTGIGETNIFLFGEGGRQLAGFEIAIGYDLLGLEATIRDLLPGTAIRVESLNLSVVLSGTAHTPEEAAQAADLASRFVGGALNVVNMIQVGGSDQVNIRVVIAEMQRNALVQFGIDAEALLSQGAVSIGGDGLAGLFDTDFGGGDSVSVLVNLLNEQGVMRTLAEPNLTAISGESAEFLVGGEIPVIIGIDEDGIATVEYKEYGVQLNFTPVVLSAGRISLAIETEISEIDNSVQLQLENGGPPGLRTRRARTTVELPSGGSIALGGLLQDNITQTINGVPGLMDVPILGSLFRSNEYQRSQSELVILVTPYTVDPVATSALQRPDQNYAPASTTQMIFLNQLNRVYGVPGTPAPGPYYGRYGFVYD